MAALAQKPELSSTRVAHEAHFGSNSTVASLQDTCSARCIFQQLLLENRNCSAVALRKRVDVRKSAQKAISDQNVMVVFSVLPLILFSYQVWRVCYSTICAFPRRQGCSFSFCSKTNSLELKGLSKTKCKSTLVLSNNRSCPGPGNKANQLLEPLTSPIGEAKGSLFQVDSP